MNLSALRAGESDNIPGCRNMSVTPGTLLLDSQVFLCLGLVALESCRTITTARDTPPPTLCTSIDTYYYYFVAPIPPTHISPNPVTTILRSLNFFFLKELPNCRVNTRKLTPRMTQ
jgi:hypothetical protein